MMFLTRIPAWVVSPFLAAALAVSLPAAAGAAGQHAGGHGPSIGQPGKPADAVRTIEITMRDNSFEPAAISVAQGETVRFVVVNEGEFVHEFNIGTAAMHAGHQKEMMVMMEKGVLEADRINRDMMKGGMGHSHGTGGGMAHDDPNSVLLEPGESAEIVWTFTSHAELQMACNVPGHYQAGMVGEIRVR